ANAAAFTMQGEYDAINWIHVEELRLPFERFGDHSIEVRWAPQKGKARKVREKRVAYYPIEPRRDAHVPNFPTANRGADGYATSLSKSHENAGYERIESECTQFLFGPPAFRHEQVGLFFRGSRGVFEFDQILFE